MANKLTPELLEKAKQAKTPEELLALAKENGAEITEESAKAYFEQLHKTGELTDDELDNVSGGGCHAKDGRLVVTTTYWCKFFITKEPGISPICSLFAPAGRDATIDSDGRNDFKIYFGKRRIYHGKQTYARSA